MNNLLTWMAALALLLSSYTVHARFMQADTWQGINQQPITLNKYTYGNSDPANHTDPTGNFSLASLGTANNIRAALSTATVRAPHLGFTFIKSSSGHIVGIASTTCVASYAATNFGITMPVAQFSQACDGSSHRGRWQAQGGGIDKSKPWSQSTPLTLTQGLNLLDELERSLSRRELRAREQALIEARLFARRVGLTGGISSADFPTNKSFPRGVRRNGERVDLEVRAGRAFVPD